MRFELSEKSKLHNPLELELLLELGDYVDNLLDLIFHEVFQDPAPYVNEVLKISKPEDLSAYIREHSAYLEHRAEGQDHPDSPAQVASTPANKASLRQIPYGY
ncbi:unnamed protein product [Pleuronectes platessa]|uniref:Uncharacterized protein n=1 Tax=Pleuronectes platessa TaxID=8262 RepID=A0A9N7YML0_PLEPL|nr:unnamed protein product [Pleuronectes platessa]